MKRFVLTLISIMFFWVLSYCILDDNLFASQISLEQEEVVLNANGVITEKLLNYIEKTRSETVSVNIQIKDEIDIEKIEEQVLENCQISKEELEIMEEYSYSLTDEENLEYQKELLAVYDKIFIERKNLLKSYYEKLNRQFISKQGYIDKEVANISKFTPFIKGISLSVDEICMLADSDLVTMIDLYETSNESYDINSTETGDNGTDYPSVEDTVSIIRGNVAKNAGYTGNGIRVGVIEPSTPDLNEMGNDASNIFIVSDNSNTTTGYHSTVVCGIIKKMVPDCSIYSYSAYEDNSINALSYLLENYNVSVVNMSFGTNSAMGEYNYYSSELDYYVNYYKVSIVVAAGNMTSSNAPETTVNQTEYVSNFAMSPNVIAVGCVKSTGVNQNESSAYSRTFDSSYVEVSSAINRPDISAPGFVNIYSYGNKRGTSFSAPHVTGTIVQMISRNAGLLDKPTILKAAVMASATYGTTNREYMYGTIVDDYEGAGVIDAGFCYDVAKNGRRTHFDASVTTTSYSYDVYCDYEDRPFRIACAWNTYSYIDSNGHYSQLCNDYDIVVYKNGIPIAESVGSANQDLENIPNTNYEIVELEVSKVDYWGAGYYEVRIERNGNAMTSGPVRIGLAWEQP